VVADVLVWILLVGIGILAIPVVVFLVQVLSAAWPVARRGAPASAGRPPLAVLVPAHNESAGIAATCHALARQLSPQDRLLVVADNCTDDTAERARKAGAEVVVRQDTAMTGKGYALDFGVRHLEKNPPAVLIVVDADCELGESSLERLAQACLASLRPAQAAYLMRNHPGAPLSMRIAEFAGVVKNLVRPLGYHRLGLPCMLMGTGMAFPWDAISAANLASGHIVEDMKLGVDLACAGSPPLFCPDARVVSFFPESLQGFRTQRQRWEHGHLGVILSDAPSLLAAGIRRGDRRLVAMALDLAVPPLALLTLLAVLACFASIVLAMWLADYRALYAGAIVIALLLLGVAVAWVRFARPIIAAHELAFAPFYALLKIPMYVRYLYARQVSWVRSARKSR
jgi:cellulose synthase/poly-beta-1,6-N-acetylglucosamine synthase-like glycosyltransferase